MLELVANAMDMLVWTLLFNRRLLPKYNSKCPTIIFMLLGLFIESIPVMWNINKLFKLIIIDYIIITFKVIMKGYHMVLQKFEKTREMIINVMELNGIIFDDELKESIDSDVDLTELISDSIQWISIILDLENAFDIEWPDDLLTINNFKSLNALSTLICNVLKNEE